MGVSKDLHNATRSELVEFSGTDLGVRISLNNGELTVEVMKADTLVYRVVVEQATGPIANAWIVDLFMRSDRVRLADMSAEVTEYLGSLNIAQG
jgi:hypothetical protein